MRVAACLLVLLCVSNGSAQIRQIVPKNAPAPVGPYSPGLFAGDYLYVSGQGARDAAGKLPDTFEGQVKQTIENVKAIVDAAGLNMDHVVYTQVYLADMSKYAVMDKIYKQYFPGVPPARAVLGVTRMPTDTPVEITAVAARDASARMWVQMPGTETPAAVSPGLVMKDRVYISGILGRDMERGIVPNSPKAQVSLVLNRLRRVLKEGNLDYGNLVMLSVYVTKAIPGDTVRSMFSGALKKTGLPTISLIEVPALPLGANIELTGVAVRDVGKKTVSGPCVGAAETLYCGADSVAAGDLEGEVRATFSRLMEHLKGAGMDASNIVASNVYLDSIDEFAVMNKTYASFFAGNPPTRTTVQPMPPGANGSKFRLAFIAVKASK